MLEDENPPQDELPNGDDPDLATDVPQGEDGDDSILGERYVSP